MTLEFDKVKYISEMRKVNKVGKCFTVRLIRLEEFFFFCDMRMISLIVFLSGRDSRCRLLTSA